MKDQPAQGKATWLLGWRTSWGKLGPFYSRVHSSYGKRDMHRRVCVCVLARSIVVLGSKLRVLSSCLHCDSSRLRFHRCHAKSSQRSLCFGASIGFLSVLPRWSFQPRQHAKTTEVEE